MLQGRYSAASHVRLWWVAPPYVRLVAMTLALGLFLAASAGWFGDFVMFTTFGVTMGSLIATWVNLASEWRLRRRGPIPPWADPPVVDLQRHLRVGGSIGGAVGLTLAFVDLLVVPL